MTLISMKVIGIGSIWLVTYDFLLIFYCNYVSVLYRFRDIIYLPKFKEVRLAWKHPLLMVVCHACASTCHDQSFLKCLLCPFQRCNRGVKFKNESLFGVNVVTEGDWKCQYLIKTFSSLPFRETLSLFYTVHSKLFVKSCKRFTPLVHLAPCFRWPIGISSVYLA